MIMINKILKIEGLGKFKDFIKKESYDKKD